MKTQKNRRFPDLECLSETDRRSRNKMVLSRTAQGDSRTLLQMKILKEAEVNVSRLIRVCLKELMMGDRRTGYRKVLTQIM